LGGFCVLYVFSHVSLFTPYDTGDEEMDQCLLANVEAGSVEGSVFRISYSLLCVLFIRFYTLPKPQMTEDNDLTTIRYVTVR